MAKRITKIIAALGVVAGLGIAALPISSYAAEESSQDVTVRFTINETTGTVAPSCESNTAGSTGAAGEAIEGTCDLGGSSNTGIQIKIKDKDSTTAATHTDNTTTIPALSGTANLTDSAFAFANLGTGNLPSGGAWGYKFTAGSTAGLTVQGNYGNWNGVTASDVTVAQADAAVNMNGAKFDFRAVTPASQKPGVYSDIVVVTVTTYTP